MLTPLKLLKPRWAVVRCLLCNKSTSAKKRHPKVLRKIQEEYFSQINPEDFQKLLTTQGDKGGSVWDSVWKWPRNYREKIVLMDLEVHTGSRLNFAGVFLR